MHILKKVSKPLSKLADKETKRIYEAALSILKATNKSLQFYSVEPDKNDQLFTKVVILQYQVSERKTSTIKLNN